MVGVAAQIVVAHALLAQRPDVDRRVKDVKDASSILSYEKVPEKLKEPITDLNALLRTAVAFAGFLG